MEEFNYNQGFQKQQADKILKSYGIDIEKGGKIATIGEIRTWNGKKYKKQVNGKWLEVSESHELTKQGHEYQSNYSKEMSQKPSLHTETHESSMNWHAKEASKLSDKEHSDEEVGLDSKSDKKEDKKPKEEKKDKTEKKLNLSKHTDKELDEAINIRLKNGSSEKDPEVKQLMDEKENRGKKEDSKKETSEIKVGNKTFKLSSEGEGQMVYSDGAGAKYHSKPDEKTMDFHKRVSEAIKDDFKHLKKEDSKPKEEKKEDKEQLTSEDIETALSKDKNFKSWLKDNDMVLSHSIHRVKEALNRGEDLRNSAYLRKEGFGPGSRLAAYEAIEKYKK